MQHHNHLFLFSIVSEARLGFVYHICLRCVEKSWGWEMSIFSIEVALDGKHALPSIGHSEEA